jgi:2-oxoglutarate dehydrogenase E1 component
MNGELVSALDGNWAQIERAVGDQIRAKAQTKGAEISQAQVQQATRDSVARLMLIRAYRVRGHLHAKLDPLNFEPRLTDEELHPSHYGLTDADWDRRIFLDHVLGLEFGTIREIVGDLRPHLLPDARRRVHAHLEPRGKSLDPGAHRGPDKEITFTPEGKRAILNKLVEAEGLREIPRPQIHRHQALRARRRRVPDPGAGADHQARRQSRREGDRARMSHRGGSTC